MAVNWGNVGNPATAAEHYAQEAAMLPDLGAEFVKGEKRYQDMVDRERRMKFQDLQYAQAQLDYTQDLDKWDQLQAERGDLDNEVRGLTQASDQYNQDVCATAALTVGESSSGCVDGLPSGWQNWSDKRKKQFIQNIKASRADIDSGREIANRFAEPEYLANNGIDPNEPENQRLFKVAENFDTARKGSCRTVSGTDAEVCDIIVSVDGEDVVIKDGDVEAFFANTRKSANPTVIDGLIDFASLSGPEGQGFINEQSLETKRAEFNELFAGNNPELSLYSFSSRFKDQDDDGDFDIDDAWLVYKTIKIGELKESGNYGVPTNVQANRLKLEKAKIDLNTANLKNEKAGVELNRIKNPTKKYKWNDNEREATIAFNNFVASEGRNINVLAPFVQDIITNEDGTYSVIKNGTGSRENRTIIYNPEEQGSAGKLMSAIGITNSSLAALKSEISPQNNDETPSSTTTSTTTSFPENRNELIALGPEKLKSVPKSVLVKAGFSDQERARISLGLPLNQPNNPTTTETGNDFVSKRHKTLENRLSTVEPILQELQLKEEEVCKTKGLDSNDCKAASQRVANKQKEVDKIKSQIEEEKANSKPKKKSNEEIVDELLEQ